MSTKYDEKYLIYIVDSKLLKLNTKNYIEILISLAVKFQHLSKELQYRYYHLSYLKAHIKTSQKFTFLGDYYKDKKMFIL